MSMDFLNRFSDKELEHLMCEKGMALLETLDGAVAERILAELLKPPTEWGILAGVFVRVVLQAMLLGHPLALPPEVIKVYEAAEPASKHLSRSVRRTGTVYRDRSRSVQFVAVRMWRWVRIVSDSPGGRC